MLFRHIGFQVFCFKSLSPAFEKTQHLYIPVNDHMSLAGKWGPRIESRYFLIKHGDVIPASYVSLPEGNISLKKYLEDGLPVTK